MKILLVASLFFLAQGECFAAKGGVQEWTPKYQKSNMTNGASSKIKNANYRTRVMKSPLEGTSKISSSANSIIDNDMQQSVVAKNKPVQEDEKTPQFDFSDKNMSEETKALLVKYSKKYKGAIGVKMLKAETMKLKQKAVPALIKVMKDGNYPEKNRWVATFMLGKIMGKKSAAFVSRFSYHPSWMMRLASLKVLLALGQKKYKGIYARLLKDKAIIVRVQALENIKQLKIKELAPYVWAMLYDKSNYSGDDGQRKRSDIIKDIIKTMGDLKFDKAKKPMLTMIQNKKYKDIFDELDYSLNKLSAKNSPKGTVSAKRHFWKRQAIQEKTI